LDLLITPCTITRNQNNYNNSQYIFSRTLLPRPSPNADWIASTELNWCQSLTVIQPPSGLHRKHVHCLAMDVYCCSERASANRLPTNGCPIVERLCCGNLFTEPLPSNSHMRHNTVARKVKRLIACGPDCFTTRHARPTKTVQENITVALKCLLTYVGPESNAFTTKLSAHLTVP
jgi:hypothetical protein